jgi:hypothetical protein
VAREEKVKFLNFCALQGRKRELLLYHAQGSADQLTIDTTMKNKYTAEQIASSYDLWIEYVDPSGVDTQESFEAMSVQERIEIINACFA